MTVQGGSTHRDQIITRWPWGPWGQKFLSMPGLMLDALQEGLRQGMLAHMPGLGDPSSLPYIGNDRQIDRGFVEADAAYALRLQQSFDVWAIAGNAWSILRNLLGFVSPFVPTWRTVTSGGIWDSMNDPNAAATGTPTWRVYASPSNWDWDSATRPSSTSMVWRFFTILYPPAGLWTNGTTWGAASLTWGGYTGSWGLSASPGQVQSMRKIVSKWLPASRWCHWMIVSFDATLFPPTATLPSSKLPDGTWGPWSKTVSGQRVPSRAANAVYCDGTT